MLLLAALPAALGLVAPTRHLSPRAPALHATNADWRSKCDSDGVVSYYDFGLRLSAAAPAAAPAPAAPAPAERPRKRDYVKLKVAELKDLLRGRGLKVSGKKAELVERLEESD